MMGFLTKLIFGDGGAKAQAKATMDSANMVAASDRETARGSIMTMASQIAQRRAADKASELLAKPQQKANVLLATDTEAPSIDPRTGRRKTTRSSFFKAPTSGINIP